MTAMANDQMMTQMSSKPGFIAALDQSGGSTPGALKLYGIPESEFKGDDAKMFELVHEMRVRIITAPSFTGEKVIAAILFERTMDGQAKGKPVPTYLWQERGVVPIVKVDKGLAEEKDGVHRRHRQAAVRIWRTDLEPWAHPHPRAGSVDQEPR
jgi:fructose-bisphosphate aldolase class I